MNGKFLQTAKHLLAVSVLLGFTIMAHATTFIASTWTRGFETANWKGAYVCANKGADGDLSNAFDGKFGDGVKLKYGAANSLPIYIDLFLETPQVFTKYDFHTLDWIEGVRERSPKEWKLEGSNDSQNWTELDYRDNGADYFTSTWQKVEFSFTNTTAYQYYRLTFLSSISGPYFGLMEIDFPEYISSGPRFLDVRRYLTMTTGNNLLDQVLLRTSDSSIKINSAVYSDASLTELGVVYSQSESQPTVITGTKVTGSYTTNPLFTAEITGLNANTTYYVRPFASTATTTVYGEVFAVTTASVDVTSFFSSELIINSNKATLSVTVKPLFGAVTERGVVWSDQPAPTVESSQKYVDATTTEQFKAKITNLSPATRYYARPYVIQDGTVIYGIESTFYTSVLAQCNWKEGATVTTCLTREISWWGNRIDNAFDANPGTRFTGTSETHLLFSFDKGHKLQEYTLGNADASNRYPLNWVIKASNDNATWTTLHAVTSHVWNAGKSNVSYSFANDNYYKYYILEAANGGTTNSTEIAEFNFPQYPNPDTGTSIDVDADEELAVRSFVDSNNRVVVLNTSEEPVRAELYNAIGQKVYSQELSARINVIGAAVKSGMYVLQLNSPAVGTVVNKLIIK